MQLRLATVGFLALLLAAPLAGRVKVQVEVDPNFDFAPLKTFSWPADGPGQMKMVLTKDDDPEALRVKFEPVIVAAVDEALAKRGFTKAAAGQPADFTMAYFGLVSTNQQAQTMGQFLPGSTAWGIPPFLAVTQSLKIYEQGSLVLDVRRPDGNVVWRGLGQAEMNRARPDAERIKRLRDAVNDILKQFPPKKRK